MKKGFIFLLFAFSCFSCNAQKEKTVSNKEQGIIEKNYLNIDIPTAKKMIAQSKNLVIIDVRTPEEIALGKIKDALEMDIKAPDFKERMAKLDKDKQYLVYCHAGGRSATAMQMMKEMGFKQVYNMEGGWKEWSKAK